jgi:hypothetical protein
MGRKKHRRRERKSETNHSGQGSLKTIKKTELVALPPPEM